MPGKRYGENPWVEGKGARKYENTGMFEPGLSHPDTSSGTWIPDIS